MLREDERLEFKKTTGELNEALVSISAILNKHGSGRIYFGIKNDGSPYKFEITDSTLRDISRKIYEHIKPQIFPIIERETVEGIEVIHVDFEGEEAPYSAFGKYYIRVADEDREMTPAELKRTMIATNYEEKWEDRLTAQTLEDVNDETLRRFYDQAIGSGRLSYMEYDKEKLLVKLELYQNGRLTNAGKVLFSKNASLVLKMAVFATEHKQTFIDIQREEGNIFELIDKGVAYVMKNTRWRAELSEDGIHRKEIPEVPISAIREAIVNSFAHAKFDVPVQHEIDIFSDRISIVNPGSFANEYRPIDFYTNDLSSFLRNEKISKVLYLCKNIESFGSGLRKIYNECEMADVLINYINSNVNFTIEFFRKSLDYMQQMRAMNYENIKVMENSKVYRALRDKKSGKNPLNTEKVLTYKKGDKEQILELIMENPRITVERMAESVGKSARTVSRVVATLKDEGKIIREGSNKKGFWKVL